jgi:hypothetical protein
MARSLRAKRPQSCARRTYHCASSGQKFSDFARINLRLGNRRGCTQRLHDVLHVRLDRRFDRRLDHCDQRLDMSGRFAFGTATLMSEHNDQAHRQMIDRILVPLLCAPMHKKSGPALRIADPFAFLSPSSLARALDDQTQLTYHYLPVGFKKASACSSNAQSPYPIIPKKQIKVVRQIPEQEQQ